MKRFLVLAVSMAFVVTACGSDDNPLTPGAVDDPGYGVVSEEFDVVNDDTNLMGELAFDAIDGIFAAKGGVLPAAGEFGRSLSWDEESKSWISTFNFVGERGATVSASTTVQFFHGSDAVQWPDELLLTSVSTRTDMQGNDGEGNTFDGSQDLVIIPPSGDDILEISGSGGYNASYSSSHNEGTGTTTCDVDVALTTNISGLRIDESELATCDLVGGSITHSGNFSAACTGENEVTVNRHWTVSASWDDAGTGTIRFISGGNVWEITEPCEAPA